MSTLKELAKQAGVNTGTDIAAEEAPKQEAPKTVGDLVQGKKKAPKKKANPRPKVDDAWIDSLRAKANEQFGDKPQFGNATVDFTVAKSKGRFVSLTPKLIYDDQMAKSAGPKHRVGFCTNRKWDIWLEKLEKALIEAHSAERRAPKQRKASGQWAAFATSVKEAMGEDITIKSISKKLSIKLDGNRVTLKREGDDALVSSAAGDPAFITDVLKAVSGASFVPKDEAPAEKAA